VEILLSSVGAEDQCKTRKTYTHVFANRALPDKGQTQPSRRAATVYSTSQADLLNEIQPLEDVNAELKAELQQLKSFATSSVLNAAADNIQLAAGQAILDLSTRPQQSITIEGWNSI
jgi:hypothetical protein